MVLFDSREFLAQVRAVLSADLEGTSWAGLDVLAPLCPLLDLPSDPSDGWQELGCPRERPHRAPPLLAPPGRRGEHRSSQLLGPGSRRRAERAILGKPLIFRWILYSSDVLITVFYCADHRALDGS